MKKWYKLVLFVVIVGILGYGGFTYYKYDRKQKEQQELAKQQLAEEQLLQNIKNHYFNYVVVPSTTKIYNSNYEEIGYVNTEMTFELESLSDITLENKYFKIANSDYYLNYETTSEGTKQDKDKRYLKYLPFNENIVTSDTTNLYQNDTLVLSINREISLPIIMKKNNMYYVNYLDDLYGIKQDEATIVANPNTNEPIATSVAVLNYHFFYSKALNENCGEAICLETTKFEEQLKYFTDNNYVTLEMAEMEMFLDQNINLPAKSVLLTIDDGAMGVANKAIPLLEKYDQMATLFLITGWWELSKFQSDHLEVHSHTNDMHHGGKCPNGAQGAMMGCVDHDKGLADLKKSREILNNTPYFCFPFYAYNEFSIGLVKEAGFRMAFVGGNKKATLGIDKFKVPRFVIYDSTTLDQIIKMVS